MPGKKGHTNNPDGRPKGAKGIKNIQWEALGDFMTKEGAEKAMRVINRMNDEQYLEQYGKLLNYFKPRMSSASIESKSDVYIKLVHPDDDLMDKI